MTAIGFLFLLIGAGIAKYDDFDRVPHIVLAGAAVLFWLGVMLAIAGFTVWLWRVMP